MTSFTEKKCTACTKGTPSISGHLLEKCIQEIGGQWVAINEHHIEKEFLFKDFKEALAFVNKIGELAELEQHHPNIHLSWGKVRILLWTHAINAISENDFVLAAKIDQIK